MVDLREVKKKKKKDPNYVGSCKQEIKLLQKVS